MGAGLSVPGRMREAFIGPSPGQSLAQYNLQKALAEQTAAKKSLGLAGDAYNTANNALTKVQNAKGIPKGGFQPFRDRQAATVRALQAANATLTAVNTKVDEAKKAVAAEAAAAEAAAIARTNAMIEADKQRLAAEQAAKQAADLAADLAAKQAAELAAKQAAELAAKQATDRATELAAKQAAERASAEEAAERQRLEAERRKSKNAKEAAARSLTAAIASNEQVVGVSSIVDEYERNAVRAAEGVTNASIITVLAATKAAAKAAREAIMNTTGIINVTNALNATRTASENASLANGRAVEATLSSRAAVEANTAEIEAATAAREATNVASAAATAISEKEKTQRASVATVQAVEAEKAIIATENARLATEAAQVAQAAQATADKIAMREAAKLSWKAAERQGCRNLVTTYTSVDDALNHNIQCNDNEYIYSFQPLNDVYQYTCCTKPTGEQGARGLPGFPGNKGDPGMKGSSGDPGARGPAGGPGTRGAQGPVGGQGGKGPSGQPGTNSGTRYVAGLPGPIGSDGPAGPTGPKGPVGKEVLSESVEENGWWKLFDNIQKRVINGMTFKSSYTLDDSSSMIQGLKYQSFQQRR